MTLLRQWQQQAGYTGVELARRCGISRASMSQKLDGIRSLSQDELLVLVRACHEARQNGREVEPVAGECITKEPARYRARKGDGDEGLHDQAESAD